MAAQYNYFGLTVQDVLDAFPGVILQDLGGSAQNATAIIEKVMDNQEEYIVTSWSRGITRHIFGGNDIAHPYVRIENLVKDAYEGQTTFKFSLPVDYTHPKNKVWVITGRTPIYGGSLEATVDLLPTLQTMQYSPTTAWVSGANNTGVLQTPMREWDTLYASYGVDVSQLELPSVKAMLRDMVCAEIGYRLFTKGHDKWDYVERFEALRKEHIATLKDQNYIPTELMRMRFLYDINPEFRSRRQYRSN